jgi:DNA-binding SARP family transcriptional activator
MEFGILGPLEARHEGQAVALGGHRVRLVLAALLLDANQVVTIEQLAEVLWQGEPPPKSRRQVQNIVSDLRRVLASGGTEEAISTESSGYVLRVEAGALDSREFEFLAGDGLASGQAGLRARAVRRLRAALGLWRGPALAGIGGWPIEAASARLNERRLSVLEACLDHELALGGHREVVSELAGLTREHPFRERFTAQFMIALYRSGRAVDALAAYRQFRGRLAADTGLDPGHRLGALQQAILRHDASLGLDGWS